MKRINKFLIAVLAVAFTLGLVWPITAFAATSPTLAGSEGYSVLGGAAVTNTGTTTTDGSVGVSPGTSITGFPPGIASGDNNVYLHSTDASAIAAQADALTAFDTLDQTCDQTFGAVDLTTTFPAGVGPGVYCSTSSFSLSGNLTLTGSGVWIFKTVSTLITSSGSSVTGGDPCNVWWRVGSSTTLGTTTSFIGTVISRNGVNAMNTGATLSGRFLALSAGTVTLDSNTITTATCAASAVDTTTTAATDTATVAAAAEVAKKAAAEAVAAASRTKLPGTGIFAPQTTLLWSVILLNWIFIISIIIYLARRKRQNY